MVLTYTRIAYVDISTLSTLFSKLIPLFLLSVVEFRINTSPPIEAFLERARMLLVEQRVRLDQVQLDQERYIVLRYMDN